MAGRADASDIIINIFDTISLRIGIGGGFFLTANQKSYPRKKLLIKNIIAKRRFVIYFVLPQKMLNCPVKFFLVFILLSFLFLYLCGSPLCCYCR